MLQFLVTRQIFALIGPAVVLIFALTFLLIWLLDRARWHILCFSLAFAFYSLGVTVQILDLTPESGLETELSALLYLLSAISLVEGLLQRASAGGGTIRYVAVVTAILSAISYFHYISDNLAARICIQNIGMALILLVALPRLGSMKRGMLTDRILYWALLLFALHFVPRTLLVIVSNGALDGLGASPFWVVLQIAMPLFGMVLALSLLATSAADTITDLQREKDTDPLTGLLNRRGFDATAERVIGTSRDGLFSLIVCDIDHFKSINDTYGHRSGDNVLRSVATILREASRGGDVVARIGGEEFVVLLRETDAVVARMFAEGLRENLERARFTAVAPGRSVTASFGIAQRRDGETVWDVVSRADRALYGAKNAGRNRSLIDGVETFSPAGYDSSAAAYRRAR